MRTTESWVRLYGRRIFSDKFKEIIKLCLCQHKVAHFENIVIHYFTQYTLRVKWLMRPYFISIKRYLYTIKPVISHAIYVGFGNKLQFEFVKYKVFFPQISTQIRFFFKFICVILTRLFHNVPIYLDCNYNYVKFNFLFVL